MERAEDVMTFDPRQSEKWKGIMYPGVKNTGPWRIVTRIKFLRYQKAMGFAAACGLWRHYLECGHVQDRTDSKAHVKKARCWDCRRGTDVPEND